MSRRTMGLVDIPNPAASDLTLSCHRDLCKTLETGAGPRRGHCAHLRRRHDLGYRHIHQGHQPRVCGAGGRACGGTAWQPLPATSSNAISGAIARHMTQRISHGCCLPHHPTHVPQLLPATSSNAVSCAIARHMVQRVSESSCHELR